MAKIFPTSSWKIGFLLFIVFWGFPAHVWAADFKLTPMLQEVTLQDEQEKKIEITLTNTTDAISTFQLTVFDFGSLDESGGVAFLGASQNLEAKYALASWMHPEKESVTLLPGKSETIPILIENRESLAPGGHYGAVVFESEDAGNRNTSNVIAVKQMIASLVLVKKTGGAKETLELTEVQQERNPFSFSKRVTLRFHNPGNIHVVPRGVVEVMDPIGRLVYRGIINEASALIMPESFRLFPLELYGVMPAWIPGPYHLEISYRFDEKTEPQMWRTNFFLFPSLTSVSLLGLCAILTGVFFWNRRRNRMREAL